MIKELPRLKNQDPDHEEGKNEYPDKVKREDGLPTIDDLEKLLGKEVKKDEKLDDAVDTFNKLMAKIKAVLK